MQCVNIKIQDFKWYVFNSTEGSWETAQMTNGDIALNNCYKQREIIDMTANKVMWVVGAYPPTESNPVQSSPVTLTKMRQCLRLTCNGLRNSAYTAAVSSRVESSRVESSRGESSRVPRVLPSQESWCRIFHFCQSGSSDRAWLLRKKWMWKSWFS